MVVLAVVLAVVLVMPFLPDSGFLLDVRIVFRPSENYDKNTCWPYFSKIVSNQVVMHADAAFLPMLLDDSSSLKKSLFAFLDNYGGRRLISLLFDFSAETSKENFAMINDSIIIFLS